MKKRIVTLSAVCLAALALAVGYLVLWRLTGYGLVCPIKHFLSLDCPGCGITRALYALLTLDFRAMLSANLLSPLTVVYCGTLAVRTGVTYLKTGRPYSSSKTSVFDISFLVLFLLYGILRNTPLLDSLLKGL
ncbi:MAG: DUF2752 domain-containing protein [Clostridia bacterium]|nr:DUF2752 domain-containing protein [Clostridia bacterium]